MSCSVLQERPPPHVHTYDMTSWEKDDDNHWHKATCEHTEEVKDKAAHTWDEGKETKAAGYGTVGERTYTCTVCEKTKTEPIAALEAKDCSVAFAMGYSPNISYNGKPIAIDKSKVVRIANGETTAIDDPSSISFVFKTSGADDIPYSDEAPKEPGHYMVKVIVAASPEWIKKEYVQEFYITAKALTFVTPPTKVFDGNAIINVEKEKLVGIANEENISVEIDTKKSDVINPTQTPTGYSYVIKDNGNITKNYTITDNELHKARIVAKEVDFLPSYTFEVIYDKVKQWKLGCDRLFGGELSGYDFIVNYKNENAGSAYDSHFFEKDGKTSYNYKLTSDAERIVKTSTIQKSKLKLTQTSYSIYVQNSSDNFCYFVLHHINESSNPYRAIKCTYNTPLYSTVYLTNATFEPDNNYEVVVPNDAKLFISDTINGSNEINIGNTKVFAADGNFYRDIKLNGVVEGTKYSIQVTCNPSRNYQKTVFSVDSTGTTVQLLPKTDQTQRDSFIATGSGTYYLRISNLESDVTCTVNFKKVE